jgi:hypothetical protein
MILIEFHEPDNIRALKNRVGKLVAVFHRLTVDIVQMSAANSGTYCADDFQLLFGSTSTEKAG